MPGGLEMCSAARHPQNAAWTLPTAWPAKDMKASRVWHQSSGAGITIAALQAEGNRADQGLPCRLQRSQCHHQASAC